MMDQLVARFTEQLTEAIQIGDNATIRPHSQPIRQIYVSGLGGSGIGANFVAEFIRDFCPLPYMVGKGYHVPAFVDQHTLAIASSYSGNTEETLSSFDQLLKTGAKLIVIASGGKLIQLAKEHDLDYIQVPDNWPSPRACLGYSLVQQLFVLYKTGIISREPIDQVASAARLLDEESENIREKARHIGQLLYDKLPVIYTTDRMESVAVRFRQQVDENAKMLCWHHVIPEMNHNELVGWRSRYENIAVVLFRNKDDFDRNALRMDITKEIISEYAGSVIELYSKGQNLIERSLYFVHLGDWISVEMAALRNMDAVEVKVIDYLKNALKDA
jgi:glucose/mannose-6-phosphate isomerase